MKSKIFFLLGISLAYIPQTVTKVLILTCVLNRPDFIEVQAKTLNKFVQDEYEFVVFNDARARDMEEKITQTCVALGIRCIRIPQAAHDRPYLPRLPGEGYNDPCVRAANVVMYALNTIGFDHDDIVALLDSDLFVVKPVSFRALLSHYDIMGVPQGRGHVQYLWAGFFCLNIKTLPNVHTLNFNCGRIEGYGVDAGGHTYYYMKNNPQVRIGHFNCFHTNDFKCSVCAQEDLAICTHNEAALRASSCGMSNDLIKFLYHVHNVEFFHNGTFLHYRGGTNWDHKSAEYVVQKTRAFNQFIEDSLSAYP